MNNKHIYNTKKRITRTIGKQNLIAENDRILVALSGGKDSLILLESLVEYKKHCPYSFDLIACHIFIDNMGYMTDIEYLTEFCRMNGVEFEMNQFSISLERNPKKSACFLCSWYRRKALFEITREKNCNKLAFGHHMDDAIQTLFMNMVYHGSISSLPYKFSMFENRVEVIRPLLEIPEKDLKLYAEIQNYKAEIKKCVYENPGRKEFAQWIDCLEAKHKVARKNMFRSMNNIYKEYLPDWKK